MKDFVNSIIKNKAIMAVLSILLGIILIVRQGAAVADLVRILGVLLLIAAVVNLITWLAEKKEERSNASLAGVIVCAIFGLIFTTTPGWLVALFPVLMGLAIIISSIVNITGLLQSGVRFGLFTPSLVMSIISLILGIVVLFHPGATANIIIALVGITFLANGIADLMMIFVFRSRQ